MFLIAATLQLLINSSALAEPLRKIGAWTVIGSAELGQCTMATKYTSGAYLILSANGTNGHDKTWEMFVSDRNWAGISEGLDSLIDVNFPGSQLTSQKLLMQTHKTSHADGLAARFSDDSEFSAFLSKGIMTGSHLALSLYGELMGAFSLKDAGFAYAELQNCYEQLVVRPGA